MPARAPQQRGIIHPDLALEAIYTQKVGDTVLSKVALPKDTKIAVFPGKVYARKDYLPGKVAPQHYMDLPARNGRPAMLVNAANFNTTTVGTPFRSSVVPYIREPRNGPPNLGYVMNHDTQQTELWTITSVPKGTRLTNCFGHQWGNAWVLKNKQMVMERTYQTPCAGMEASIRHFRNGHLEGKKRPRRNNNSPATSSSGLNILANAAASGQGAAVVNNSTIIALHNLSDKLKTVVNIGALVALGVPVGYQMRSARGDAGIDVTFKGNKVTHVTLMYGNVIAREGALPGRRQTREEKDIYTKLLELIPHIRHTLEL